jgi:hypothetical protein
MPKPVCGAAPDICSGPAGDNERKSAWWDSGLATCVCGLPIIKEVKLGALLLNGLGSSEYALGLISGVNIGDDVTEFPAPLGFN